MEEVPNLRTGCMLPFLSYHRGMQTSVIEGIPLLAARKLGYREARMEQLVYWSRKSIPERLAAATALTRRMYQMRGIAYDEQEADFTASRVRRQRG